MVTEGFQLVQNSLTLVGYLALIVRYSRWAALALFAASVPAAIVEMCFSRSAFRLRNWRSPESRQLNYLEYVLANDEHVKEVKLFGLGPLLLGRYRALGEKFYREDQRAGGAARRLGAGAVARRHRRLLRLLRGHGARRGDRRASRSAT